MNKGKWIFGLAMAAMAVSANAETLFQPKNMNFEHSRPGKVPASWEFAKQSKEVGYLAYSQDTSVISDKYSVIINGKNIKQTGNQIPAALFQTCDATPYRRKTISFSADFWFQPTDEFTKAFIWINQKEYNGKPIKTDLAEVVVDTNSDGTKNYSVNAYILPETYFISYGFQLIGTGVLCVDNGLLQTAGDRKTQNDAPNAISPNNIINLTTFAKIMGNLRYFSPAIEARNANWEKFALRGIEICESAKDETDYQNQINELISKVSPLAKISNSKNTEPELYQKPNTKDITGAYSVFHRALPYPIQTPKNETRILNSFASTRKFDGVLSQDFKIKSDEFLKLEAIVKYKISKKDKESFAAAGITIQTEDFRGKVLDKKTLFVNDEDKVFNEVAVHTDSALSAETVRIAIVYSGEGSCMFDDVQLLGYGKDGMVKQITVKNDGFDKFDGQNFANWNFFEFSKGAGYKIEKVNADKSAKLKITANPESSIQTPKPGQIFKTYVNQHSVLEFPVSMFGNDSTTYPKLTSNDIKLKNKKEDFAFNIDDRNSRMALVIDAWNTISIFYHKNMISTKSLDSVLVYALNKAAADKDRNEFEQTLNCLALATDNYLTKVWDNTSKDMYSLPVTWKMINGKLYVVNSLDNKTELRKGDLITKIDNMPTEQYIKEKCKLIPGSDKINSFKTLRVLADLRSTQTENSSVNIEYYRGGKSTTTNAKRNIYFDELKEFRQRTFSLIDSQFVYIDLADTWDEDIYEALPKLQNMKGIIFDARGVSNVSEHLIGLLSNKDIVFPETNIMNYSSPILTKKEVVIPHIKGYNKLNGVKCVFLVDETSVFLTHTMINEIKKHKLTKIIGRQTTPLNGEQAAARLIGEYNLSMDIKNNSDDKNLNIIMPDIFVDEDLDTVLNGGDPIFNKAYEYMKK